MLLEIDGLDEPWDGVRVPNSAWAGELGNVDEDDLPNAVQRALSPSQIREYDTSSLGAALNRNPDEAEEAGAEEAGAEDADIGSEDDVECTNEVRVVRDLSLKYFRSRLVEHFDIMFKRNAVIWPRRRGDRPVAWCDGNV